MSKFIKLTNDKGQECYIAIASIIRFFKVENGNTYIRFGSRGEGAFFTTPYAHIVLELTGGR